MNTLNSTLRRFGLFQVLFSGAVQYNSICFRVLGGLVYPNLMKSVAIVTAIEFILNALFEVPFGHLADKFGREKTSLTGLVLVALSSMFLFFAFYNHGDTSTAYTFLILNAVFIGLGKPLYSGSIEAFYHAKIEQLGKGHEDQKIISNSIAQSLKYGKLIPGLFVCGAFLFIYILLDTSFMPLAMIPASLFFFSATLFFYKDSKVKSFNHDNTDSIKFALDSSILKSNVFIISSLLHSTALLIAMLNLGYYVISLGRQMGAVNGLNLVSYSAYMLGCMVLGWITASFTLPKISKYSKKTQLIVYILFLAITNSIYLMFDFPDNYMLRILYIAIYGAIFQICFTGIMAVVKNLVIAIVPKNKTATYLSLQNIPSFILVSLASLILAVHFDGALRLAQTYNSVALLSLFGLVISLYLPTST